MDCPTRQMTAHLEAVCAKILGEKECHISYNENDETARIKFRYEEMTVNCAMNSESANVVDIIKRCCFRRGYYLG